jgi:hypothetical protein
MVRHGDKPTIGTRQVFVASIAHATKARHDDLLTALHDVCAAEAEYDASPDTESLFAFPKTLSAGDADKDALVSVYKRMRDPRYDGRKYYDQLKMSSPRCMHCNQRDVEALDHYLPKAEYPLLAVTPVNLVPACSGCNEKRNENPPTSADEMSLHPYYDDVDSEPWLKARFDEAEPAVVFYVSGPVEWPASLASRLAHQFRTLGLGRLYASEAATEISGIAHQLRKLAASGDGGVSAYLRDTWESQAAYQVNAWRTALYEAAWQSAWFCEGGFEALIL